MTIPFVSDGSPYIHDGAERAVVSALLNGSPDADAIARGALTAADFATFPLNLVYGTVREMVVTGRPRDDESVVVAALAYARRNHIMARLQPDQIKELRAWPSDMALGYAETVREMSFLRRANAFGLDVARLVEELPDSHSLYLALQASMTALRPPDALGGRRVDGVNMEAIYEALYAARAASVESPGLDFPWDSWNQRVLAVEGSTLGILAAAPSTGKSTYLSMIAEHWAKSVHVVYVDYEMGLNRFLDRQMVRYGRLPLRMLRAGAPRPAGSIASAKQVFDTFRPRLHYVDGSQMPADMLAVEIARMVDEGVCEALVVDYANKIPPSPAQAKLYAGNVYERQAADMEVLHSIARVHDIPVWTAAQVTEKSQGARGKQRLTLADMRGTSQYIDKAQVIIMASRRVLEDAPETDSDGVILAPIGALSLVVDLTVAKQNDGEGSDFKQRMDGYYTVREYYTERVNF